MDYNIAQKMESVASVASFFVSRVDSAVDKALKEIGTKGGTYLRGEVAIANSKMIYRRFIQIFYGEAFAVLQKKGAHVQRPLWASTSTKNPNYLDTLYVEALSGRIQSIQCLRPLYGLSVTMAKL